MGAGGTGTFFLKEVSRFIASLGDQAPIGKMTIIDGDIVERKNMDRQCFQEEDIGLYKASVMADLLNTAFSLCWRPKALYLESEEQIIIDCPKNSRSKISLPVLIGCVDNHPCRMVMERFFNKCDSCIYLDSANEYMSGEVVFSMKLNRKVLSPLRSSYFPEIKNKQKSRSEMSCTELNKVSPQHIAANMIAGNILLSEFAAICEGIFHGGMVVFDSKDFILKHIPYCVEQLQAGEERNEKRKKGRCRQANRSA